MRVKHVVPFFFLLLLSLYTYANHKENVSVISEQKVLNDSISSPINDTCDLCHGKGVIFVTCKYCTGTGNATYISEWRMKHEIDYWVCEHCMGRKGFYQKCSKCNKDK